MSHNTTFNNAIIPFSGNKNDLRTLVASWLEEIQLEVSPATLRNYTNCLDKFLWWLDNARPGSTTENVLYPGDITPEMLRAFVTYLRSSQPDRWGLGPAKVRSNNASKEKLSPYSVQSYVIPVRVLFTWLELKGYIKTIPFDRTIKFHPRKQEAVSRSDVPTDKLKKLIEYLNDPEHLRSYTGVRNRAFILLLLDSGIRRGELVSMRVRDVDMAQSRISVTGKTGPRVAFFSPMVATALKDYWQEYRQYQDTGPNKAYWLTSDGFDLQNGSISGIFFQLRQRTGIDLLHAHLLRHTFASMMAGKVDIFELKSMLGHSSLKVTERYVHTNINKLAEAYKGKSPLSQSELQPTLPAKKGRGRPRQIKKE